MRPARKGPENRASCICHATLPTRFNEAGPQGAGKPAARALPRDGRLPASMRPARKGPENRIEAEKKRREEASLQ